MSVYNGARYLRSGLQGVLGQRDVTLEFIVVNDGSTDSTASLLAEEVAADSRIRV